MNRRIMMSASGVTAGLLTTTFVSTGTAFADNGIDAAGDVGSTTLTSNLDGGALLGDAGALGPDVTPASPSSPTSLGSLGDTGAITPAADTPSSSQLGDTGGLTPTVGAPDAMPGATTPTAGDGFTIGQDTFTPVQDDGSAGFNPVSTLFSAPPFLQVGDADQSFDVTSGTGSGATELGTVTTSEDVSNLFGIHNTEFTITDVDPASGETASDLPAVGTVYDVANFGNGFENIYTAVPGADGAASTITDTLVTPFGDFNIPTDFDAAALLDPGDAFTGLSAVSADAAGGAADVAAGAAADAAGGAADTAAGAADVASVIDPSSFLGF